ncbi:Putative Mn2+ efflux pump MntP [Bacteroides luti]|jgi:Predicted membrane protein|uniref:Putative manganese efflux pump MntP n=1 Tax=Bacteroides luti TaxID=1297750 RepID=A0A1M5AUR8_9BACE|nr:manganese efflux pump MntP family protein [Bacteroides luti]SHF33955.1 Putative Mn2+ efflux pump MntP [Bacteroides luti]
MTNLENWLLAVGLAMDCLAVSIASGIIFKKVHWGNILTMAFFFGFFQALMPFLGWFGASRFSHLIENVDHWLVFLILAFLGGRMIWESFKDEECRSDFNPACLKVVFTLAIATSLDALAVGVSFAFMGMRTVNSIISPILIIGLVSFVISVFGLLFGIFFGCKHNMRVELWGGLILIGIGTKVLIEHLCL